MDDHFIYDQTLAKAKQLIGYINEIKPDEEYGYERIIYLLGSFGHFPPLAAELNDQFDLYRVRVDSTNELYRNKSQVGIKPEIGPGRCNPGHKSKFYCSNREDVATLETLPTYIKDKGLQRGEIVFSTSTLWKLNGEGVPVCHFVSPMDVDWANEFERESGLMYSEELEKKIKDPEALEAVKALTHYFADEFRKSKEEDPTVYHKTSAFLGYLFGFHTTMKGVFYRSTLNIPEGFNMALHTELYTSNKLTLIGAKRITWEVVGNNQFLAEPIAEIIAREITPSGDIIW